MPGPEERELVVVVAAAVEQVGGGGRLEKEIAQTAKEGQDIEKLGPMV